MVRAFGTAGVRGVFNESQTPEQVYQLAEAIVFVMGRGRYAVGWDGRKTSALLARVVTSAVMALGSDASVFGLVPTPVIAFGTRARSCFAGFSVTASHNPPEFSGVKVFDGKGMEMSKQDEDRVERALGVEVMKPSGKFGQAEACPQIVDDYIDALVSRHYHAGSGLRVAVECATGPGGDVTPRLLSSLGHTVLAVNSQVSWRFPARNPEPTKNNLADFSMMVPELSVDLALAHDGDADRLVLIDRAGNVIPDSILTVLALKALGFTGGTAVISENSSNEVADQAHSMGMRVVRSRVGKTFTALESEGGVFASEPSKIVDPAWGLWEDGMNAAALITGLISRDRGLLDRVVAESRWKYRQVDLSVGVKMPILQSKAKEAFRKLGIFEERTLDGYKLVFEDESWVMFRPSGTEPKTRIYCESTDPQRLEALVQMATECVQSSL